MRVALPKPLEIHDLTVAYQQKTRALRDRFGSRARVFGWQ